jgi:single-stranded-DNA-specific exonuclease
MAAGLSLNASALEEFTTLVNRGAQHFYAQLPAGAINNTMVYTDGGLGATLGDLAQLLSLETQVWGQGFPEPLFDDEFEILEQEILKDKHLRLSLRLVRRPAIVVRAMWFFETAELKATERLLYQVNLDRWNGKVKVTLLIKHVIN